jgi:transposase-like protein
LQPRLSVNCSEQTGRASALTAEYDGWRETALDDEPIVYIWADGVHSGLRGTDDKLCALVIVGVTARGKKRFLAIDVSAA